MRTTEQLNELATALAKAQPRFGTIARSKTVKVRTQGGAEYSFDYAPLEAIIEATRIPLSEVGLSLVHPVESSENSVTCGARLIHSSGQWIEDAITVPRPAKMQELGSVLTYCKRYCTQGVLGVQADDDDDANVADGNHVQEQKSKPPRRAPGTISKKEVQPDHAAVNAALDQAGADAFQPDEPRNSVSKKAQCLAFVRNMVDPTDAGRCRAKIKEHEEHGHMTPGECIECYKAIDARLAELAKANGRQEVHDPIPF